VIARTATFLVVLCATGSAVRADSACDAYGAEYGICRDGHSTRDIVECVTKLYKAWQLRVDAAYAKLLGMENEADRLKWLKLSQDAWLKYGDANLRVV
jgi:uncharacterized protein YecT (DUF1311 family)